MVKEFIESRKNYISKSFNDKKYQIIGSLPSDKISTLLSWLHQNQINEIDLLWEVNLHEDFNSIFDSKFTKNFQKELESIDLSKIELKDIWNVSNLAL